MFRRKLFVPLAALFVAATLSASAQIRSGNFITCELKKGCTTETIDGQMFYVLDTPQLVVKVAVDPDSKYNHVAIALENRASYGIHVTPSDFRIEVSEPKFKRLSYIEPDKLKLPKSKAVKPLPRPALASSFMSTPTQQAGGPVFLEAATLAPAATVTGEVFFERAGSGDKMSLLLPIAGAIYEFPYTPSK